LLSTIQWRIEAHSDYQDYKIPFVMGGNSKKNIDRAINVLSK